MRYKSEVPADARIRISQFKLLPGDRVLIKVKKTFYHGRVVEVASANPEYVLGGPRAKDAGLLRWKEKDRDEARAFLHGGHMDVSVKLKKSMWAVVEFATSTAPPACKNGQRKKKLYTYDIERMLKADRLRIVGK